MDADPAGNSILFNLLLLLFFTLLNAFFAGAEMAVVSVNKNRIRSMADEGNKKAKVIEGLFEDSTKFLSTIQVAITFAGFYSSASAASGISPVLAQSLEAAGVPYSSQIAYNGVTLVLMFFNLVFGELVPKRIALQKAEAFCMFTVMPVHYISIILSPFIKLLSMSTKFVYENLHLDEQTKHPDIDGMIQAINHNDLTGITYRMGNVLEQVTQKHYPAIIQIKENMRRLGALGALMSGSGSTVFGIFTSREAAGKAAEFFRKDPGIKQTAVVRPFSKDLPQSKPHKNHKHFTNSTKKYHSSTQREKYSGKRGRRNTHEGHKS